MSIVRGSTPELLAESKCLPGRSGAAPKAPSRMSSHYVTGNPLLGEIPATHEVATFGMGCFWCSEGHFATLTKSANSGIYLTRVGYSQGTTSNPTYEEVCSGQTNHVEVVQIVFNPDIRPFVSLLKDFWELHDPTTYMRQGNDVGTQYRSGIYYTTALQRDLAEKSRDAYQKALREKGINKEIVTEIVPLANFYPAEEYHQQYDLKPGSRQYCGMRPTGVELPQF
jgi:peptide-methionine (S)-S-oxide reductase